jgi:peptidoglycan/LPS O-acetylase OafA/YrhL
MAATLTPKLFRLAYMPSLDGIRGVSILWVIGVHANLIGGSSAIIGVILFFVLSGFLITSLLLEEWNGYRDISLKNFYLRRALRLLPALLVMLTVFILYSYLASPRKIFVNHARQVLIVVLYFSNWVQTYEFVGWGWIGHTWSLSVEEQFYTLWPLLLLLMLRRLKLQSVLRLVVFGTLLSVLARFYLATATAARYERLYNGLDTRAESLLLGAAVAVALASGWLAFNNKGRKILSVAAGLCAIALLMGYKLNPWDEDDIHYVGWFAMSLGGAIIITHLVTAKGSYLHRMLENRILVYLGRISYGMYLWHYPVLRICEKHGWSRWTNALVAIPVTIFIAVISYYFIELPCLKLKQKFQRRDPQPSLLTSPSQPESIGIG